ncbi:cysteine proteinase, partial [Hyphopichia burtonii NRRL Y-1933]
FDEPFWHWYADSYSRPNNYREIEGLLKPTTKKITSNSTAVTTIIKYFETLKLNPIPSSNQVVALLKSPFTQGDITKTFHLIRFYQLSSDGLFITNEGADKFGGVINYVGAENWENVMCYLDALLFSMFANLESFEPMLFISNQHDNYLNNQLGALLRLYVNLLRSGNLITTDLTIRICETLKKLGFDEAMSHKQQDSATLFEFLTETLLMPLLTFKIDIKHGGKSDKDDRKYSKERILFVSIPEDDIDDSKIPVDKKEEEEEDGILLEECLEHYFNNSISVKRELERRATFESNKRLSDLTANLGDVTINDIPEVVESNKFEPTHDHIEVSESPQRHRSDSKNQTRFQTRTRSSTLSLWSTNNPDSDQTSKEVSLPAWMFLRLLPFYTDDNDLNQLNESVAKSSTEFAKRKPILPICLKRYSFNPQNSQANRSQKRIIIPPIINLPQFVADDINDEISGEYKLILESALCHRGTSISSGHFVSAIRKNTHNINQLDDEASNATWYLYDDMKKKSRVVEKSFKDIFSTEWPYMLFYRLVSIDESNNKFNSSTSSLLLKNYNAGGSSNASINSNPIIPPKGFKTKYWSEENNDETLTPIMSISNSNVASTSSIPIPDIPPTDSKFVDIRDKYFWYVTDQNKNYFKELPNPTPTTKASSHRDFSINLNVGISTRVRRNSQWSDTASSSN